MPTLPQPRAQRLALAVATARTAFGAAMMARPGWATRPLGLDRRTADRVAYLPRMAGGRDLVLGVGAAQALLTGEPARPWLLGALAADCWDAATMCAAVRAGEVNRFAGALAAASALAAVACTVPALRQPTTG